MWKKVTQAMHGGKKLEDSRAIANNGPDSIKMVEGKRSKGREALTASLIISEELQSRLMGEQVLFI